MSIQKIKTIPSTANSFDTAIIVEINNIGLSVKNARRKFTKRKHWIERRATHGFRHCYATFDEVKDAYCKPHKGTYYPFQVLIVKEWKVSTARIGNYVEESKKEGIVNCFIKTHELDEAQIWWVSAIKGERSNA